MENIAMDVTFGVRKSLILRTRDVNRCSG